MILEDVSVEIAPTVSVSFSRVVSSKNEDIKEFVFDDKFVDVDELHLKLVEMQLGMYALGKISAVDFCLYAIERSYIHGEAWGILTDDVKEIGREKHTETEKLLCKISDMERRGKARIEKRYHVKMKELNKKYTGVHIEPEVLSAT